MAKTKKKTEATQTGFPTRPDSPFPDRFDLESARETVKDLYESSDPDQSDPRFALLMQVWDHEDELEQMKAVDKLRDHAEAIVPYQIASQRPGRLVKPSEMALHTYQAQRLFTGRKRSEGVAGIPGVMTFAKVCYQAWMLTANNNPYADYLLIQVLQEMVLIHQEIEAEIKKLKTVLEARKSRGLAHTIAESARPLVIGNISFGSPYGYKACDLLLDFDYYVRVVTTLEEVGQIKTDDSRGRKERMQHRIRSFIAKVVRQGDILRTEKLLPLSRADFARDGSDDGKVRVALAAKVLGDLPEGVIRGDVRPDYYKPVRAPAAKPETTGGEVAPAEAVGGADESVE